MKKVLLTSAAVLAVFAAAAPAFAQGEDANSSNRMNQKKYVSEADIATEANTQVEAHAAEIDAEAKQQPAVVAAAQALAAANEIVGHTHEAEVAKAQAAYDAALADATATVRNRYVQVIQEKLRAAAQAQGNYWNDATGVQDNKPNEVRIDEDQAANAGKKADDNNNGQADNNNGQADNNNGQSDDKKVAPSQEQTDKAKADAKKVAKAAAKTTAGKAAAKSGAKTLPNTAAVK